MNWFSKTAESNAAKYTRYAETMAIKKNPISEVRIPNKSRRVRPHCVAAKTKGRGREVVMLPSCSMVAFRFAQRAMRGFNPNKIAMKARMKEAKVKPSDNSAEKPRRFKKQIPAIASERIKETRYPPKAIRCALP